MQQHLLLGPLHISLAPSHLSRAFMDDSELKKVYAHIKKILHSRNLTLCLWSWKLRNSYQDQNAVITFRFTANSVRMNISHLPGHYSLLQPLLSRLCFPSLRFHVFSSYCSKAIWDIDASFNQYHEENL